MLITTTIKLRHNSKLGYVIFVMRIISMIALFIKVTSLDGAVEGIEHFMSPDWEKLNDLETWKNAARTIYFSLGLTVGLSICLSSFNKFKHDCYRTALVVCAADFMASIVLALIQMSVYGAFARRSGVSVQTVIEEIWTTATPPSK